MEESWAVKAGVIIMQMFSAMVSLDLLPCYEITTHSGAVFTDIPSLTTAWTLQP